MSEWDTTTTAIAPFFLERLFDAEIQLANCSSARGSTKLAENLGEESTFGSEHERGKGPTGCYFGGSNIPDMPTPQTVQTRAEATQAIESAF